MNQAHLDIIKRDLAASVSDIQLIDEGWSNLVYIIADTWVFRFSRQSGNAQVGLEQAFLKQFAPRSPLAVPAPVFCGKDYTAYRLIPGEKLSAESIKQLTKTEQNRIAGQLGNFLSYLHAERFRHPALVAAPYGGGDFWQDLWLPVAPQLSAATRERGEVFFANALAALGKSSVPAVVTHSDFGTNNVLKSSAALAGVIDFGDICLADPAVDFSVYFRRFGRGFVEAMLERYTLSTGENFWLRVEFEAKRKPLFVIYFAQKYGFEDSVAGMLEYTELLFS